MESYARKKTFVHILKIIGAVIGIISFIGFFVAWPWAVTVLFLVLSCVIAGAAYMHNSGCVENREGGFSLKLCVPEFIRDLAFDLWNSPAKIRAWITVKKPKVFTPHLFSKRSDQIRVDRRLSLAAKGFLRAS